MPAEEELYRIADEAIRSFEKAFFRAFKSELLDDSKRAAIMENAPEELAFGLKAVHDGDYAPNITPGTVPFHILLLCERKLVCLDKIVDSYFLGLTEAGLRLYDRLNNADYFDRG